MSDAQIRLYAESSIRLLAQRQFSEDVAVRAGWSTFGPTRSVRALAIDKGTGGVCVGTPAGVLVWDRRTATVRRYGSEHGLLSNGVSCVAVDRRGRLWAGHEEGGLSLFADGWRAAGRPDDPVVALAPLGDGVAVVTPETVYFAPDAKSPHPLWEVGPVAAILEHEEGVLAAGERGVFLLGSSAPRRLFSGRWCVGLARSADGVVWMATHGSLYRWRGEKFEEVPTPPGPPLTALASADELPWVLRGGRLFACAEGEWLDAGLAGVRALAAAPRDGHVWAGGDAGLWLAWRDGAVHVSDQLLPVAPLDAAFPVRDAALDAEGRACLATAGGLVREGQLLLSCDARQACRCADGLYLLAWPESLARWSPSGIEWLDAPEGILLAVGAGRDGEAHVLTTRGLFARRGGWAYRGDGGDEEPAGLVQTEDGTWWLGHSQGVRRLREGKWELAGEQPGPGGAEVRGLVALGRHLYAATASGLWQHDGGRWLHHSGEPLRAVCPDPHGRLWLAGERRLFRFDPAAPADAPAISAGEGTPGARVVGLACGEDLWVVTAQSVGRLRGTGDEG